MIKKFENFFKALSLDNSLFDRATSNLFQQDFRYPIWGPFGGAIFFAVARVSEDVGEFFSGTYHSGFGGGVRYIFNKERNLVIRFDAARGRDSTGYYITFGEAF